LNYSDKNIFDVFSTRKYLFDFVCWELAEALITRKLRTPKSTKTTHPTVFGSKVSLNLSVWMETQRLPCRQSDGSSQNATYDGTQPKAGIAL
jgi:hypothetical protein